MRDFQLPGRSTTFAENGMVAASHPQAALAALDVLRAGGNAVDAAVAAAALTAVVEPTQTGIGGDCFVLLKRRGQQPIALNGSGRAPASLSVDYFTSRGIATVDATSPHAVTVPGAVGAWEQLLIDNGTKGLDELLQPAIKAATEGYLVTERLSRDWSLQVEKLQHCENTRSLFLDGGRAPLPGDRRQNPALARTLMEIAAGGAQAFYRGAVAEDIVSTLKARGGLHTLQDLADYKPEYVTPISTDYRGLRLWECPPNGQGIVALTIASLMERFDVGSLNPVGPERHHLFAEATRLSYAERDQFLADPRFCPGLADKLLDRARIDRLAGRVDANRRMTDVTPYPLPEHRDTIYISVVDRDGMAVSFINSIFDDFGSGISTRDTGILLHNRGCGFSLDPAHVNVIEGGKRPMHTIIPALVTSGDELYMSFGVTGGHFQAAGQAQVLSNVVDHGMSIQQAIDAPRTFARGDTFEVERGIDAATRAGLEARGHILKEAVNPLGTCQAIRFDVKRGLLEGGADPRRDGVALGY